MKEKELLENLKDKLKEIEKIRNLNSKDLKFKSWHASTINTLKGLSLTYPKEVNSFKKLTFTDTKYHRGKKPPFNPSDENKYNQDLNAAEKLLKKILSAKKATPVKTTTAKKTSIGKKISTSSKNSSTTKTTTKKASTKNNER